ncbi:MAG: TRAP transporter substrate-binding protein DctP [Phascolarctobacterium sp.]|nr:TRAP transporter substrate-binding protein DctP [Phascolarctobacterium sp.]MBQ2975730.1 TRAP transporter substrate-binding protein DctP [Phascolarctobacterium sp.]MBQ8690877.1 TRAP transporter substrate-binding protein DctP [Phascolarctobacterium sp.]MBR2071034.1 TRAP transporter substrate-binding protein DctP [Phascolarctobacterium sp.]MBR2139293.1 TRAP transporter substrate-binding protein DctP [Phascolarctobacterium sp.]
MALTVAGCGGGDKKADQKVTLKMATALPSSHPLVKAMDTLKAKANEKSKGSVTIQIYPAGQLYNDKNMNDAIISGGIDMGLNTVGRWATIVPAMDIFDVPFIFPSYEKVDKAIDSGLGEKLGAELLKKGVRPLIWADYGFVQYANNKKLVKTPADFDGLKIRGYSKYSAETIKAMGASSVTMGSSEVYMGIQRGTIDGQTSGTTAMRDRKMYEVHKYLTVTNHASPEFIVAINEKSYSKLNADQKKALDAAALEVRDMIRANAKAEDLKALADLKAKGMEVYEVPENELQAWRDATKPVWDLFIKENGKFGQELIDICVK